MWTNAQKIADEAKFYVGAAIKIMPTPRGLEAGNFIPEGGLVYLVADSALDKSYFNCVCLSEGECGNVICCLQREGNFVTGKTDQANVRKRAARGIRKRGGSDPSNVKAQ